jgi:hypothetical protein
MKQQILALDQQGQPHRWISAELAITYHAKNLVAWQLGDADHTLFRGGENRVTGQTSRITTAPIIAIKGESVMAGKRLNRVPTLTNRELFARDRWTCAYCGKVFSELKLTRDHIIPVSRGGQDIWMSRRVSTTTTRRTTRCCTKLAWSCCSLRTRRTGPST